MTPGTKVRTKVALHSARTGLRVRAGAEGVVQFIAEGALYPIEVGFLGNYPTSRYRSDELETFE